MISRYLELIRLSLRQIAEQNRQPTNFACPILSKKNAFLIHSWTSRILYFTLRRSNKWLKIKPFSASYNGYERDISSISVIVDDRLWFHSVIQTGDLPSFLQILQLMRSSLLAWKIRVRLLFMYFFIQFSRVSFLAGFHSGIDNCICSMHSRQ